MKNGTLKIYSLANCDTCRRAVKWLRTHDVEFQEIPIRETPPTPEELRTALAAYRGERRKLFNVSGRDYREQGLGDHLDAMSDDAALALLARNGNLVKRPFAIGEGVALAGFREDAWATALLGRK